MGTLENSPVWAQVSLDPREVLKTFGWDKNTTPAQLQAALAYCVDYRETYLVDRHDEIAAGLGEIFSMHKNAVERLADAVEQVAAATQNVAKMLDMHECGANPGGDLFEALVEAVSKK